MISLPPGTQEFFEVALRERALGDELLRASFHDFYFDLAPSDARTPYLVQSWQSWRDVNDHTRVPEIDAVANIRAVVDVDRDGMRVAVRIADRIEAVFKNCALEVGNGWGVHWCRQVGRFRLPTLIDRKNLASAGCLFQIGAIKAT